MADDDTKADDLEPERPVGRPFPSSEEDGDQPTIELKLSDLVLEDGTRAPILPGLTITGIVGKGGQAKVYLGKQEYLGRAVAVKLLDLGQNSDSIDRFRREAKLLAGMQHRFIVGCYNAGTTTKGQCYIVMELIDGPDLSKHVKESGPLEIAHALEMTRDVASALAYANSLNVIHRDVKPQNILLQPILPGDTSIGDSGFGFRPKLADLGLARACGEDCENMTATGVVMGTPATMALEQFDDPESVDFRADIYGLGCVLYHALAGKAAYDGLRPSQIFMLKSNETAPRVDGIVTGVPKGVAALVSRMMASDREARPQSYAELIGLLEEHLVALGGSEERKQGAGPRSLVGAVAVCLALGGGFWFTRDDHAVEADFEGEPSGKELAKLMDKPEGSLEEVEQQPSEESQGAAAGKSATPAPELLVPAITEPNSEAPAGQPQPAETQPAEPDTTKAPIEAPTGAPIGEPIGEPEKILEPATQEQSLPALAPGERIALFDAWDSLDNIFVGWERALSEGIHWGGYDGNLNVPMVTTKGTASTTHQLPSGSWSLEGEVRIRLPFGYPKQEPYRGGVRIEFEENKALGLELVSNHGELKASWSPLESREGAWKSLAEGATFLEQPFEKGSWVAFRMEQSPTHIDLSLNNGELQRIDTTDLGLHRPSALSLTVSGGTSIWRNFVLRGR